MIFNSIEFAIFLPVVFALYWFIVNKNLKAQNVLLLAASYLFYGWWDFRFLFLLLFSSLVDYFVGISLSRTINTRTRKLLFLASIVVNLGLLGFFKYFNFFAQEFASAFTLLGQPIEPSRLSIILPVGISFYTFQTLSYSIDIYKRKIEPSRDIIAFLSFVSFFPQLVAGPIERASNLLPQFLRPRVFIYDNAVNGMFQILWGLFKKIVIADNCAIHANQIFGDPANHSGSTLVLGILFFAFQIYGDFSGYSDIAIGSARLFGFDLMRNFAFPYFSRSIAEFWRRWHISLSTWFRDYVYIPLGGSKGGTWIKIRNVFVVFLLSGFWHGANWTFIIWGALNALFILPSLLLNTNRNNLDIVAQGRLLPTISEVFNVTVTFCLTLLAWVFFRAESVSQAVDILSRIFSTSFFEIPWFEGIRDSAVIIILIIPFLLIEWIGRESEYAIQQMRTSWTKPMRWVAAYIIIMSIFLFGGRPQQFIYFQF